jgi:hypothetical protein
MSTIKTNTLSNVEGTLSVPVATVVSGSAKAWVNFNGSGTVAIRAAFNVSSITDNGTGDYTVNFTTALADANYSVGLSCKLVSTGSATCYLFTAPTTTATRLRTTETSAASLQDADYVCASVFR